MRNGRREGVPRGHPAYPKSDMQFYPRPPDPSFNLTPYAYHLSPTVRNDSRPKAQERWRKHCWSFERLPSYGEQSIDAGRPTGPGWVPSMYNLTGFKIQSTQSASEGPSQSPSEDHSQSPSEGSHDDRASQLQATLEKIGFSAPTQLEEVANALKSGQVLTQSKRKKMAKSLTRVIEKFRKVSNGISALLQAIQDGSLLPVTKGYKALQKNFNELLHEFSQRSVLRDVAAKCYSEGLITESEKNEAFNEGDIMRISNNFLQLIYSRIKRDGKAYETFLGILSTEPAYSSILVLAGGG